MRGDEQIDKIKSRIIQPYSVQNFIDQADIDHLISVYANSPTKIEKNTGPITVDIKHHINDPVIQTILQKIKNEIGDYEITAGLFFKTPFPHIIHNDDTFLLPDVYRAITIPLHIENFSDKYPKLCFFDQFYFHGPSKFFNGSSGVPTYYNQQIYEYSNVYGTVYKKFPKIIYDDFLTHLKPEWLDGLTINSMLEWKPTSAIIFDSTRLHCASDFRKLGITNKLAISIFTKKP